MIQRAKFTSNAKAIAHLLFLHFGGLEATNATHGTKVPTKKVGSEFADHLAFRPTVKEPQSEMGVHLVEHLGGTAKKPVIKVTYALGMRSRCRDVFTMLRFCSVRIEPNQFYPLGDC
jgi:hypothetical protein